MSMFSGPDEHAANPPASWRVVKAWGRSWHLVTLSGVTLDTFDTRRAGLAAIEAGYWARQYDTESRWYAGETVPGWRSWAEVSAGQGDPVERERLRARRAELVKAAAARLLDDIEASG